MREILLHGLLRLPFFVGLLLSATQISAQLVPDGPEFGVNEYTTGDQLWPSVCAHPDGAFVVAWRSAEQDGSSYGVFARRYDLAASPLDGEFQVNTYTTGSQSYPELCCADNQFVVVWESRDQDGDSIGLFGRIFDKAGLPVTGEFQVNDHTTGLQFTASVACQDDGTFVVVWNHTTDAIRGRRFSEAGTPLGGEIKIVESQAEVALGPSVAMQPGGDFVVVWASYGRPDEYSSIYGKRFDGDGMQLGTEFHANTYTTGEQHSAEVAADGHGRFVVTWFSNVYPYGAGQDGSQAGVFARAFDTSGNVASEELQINSYTTDHQTRPAIASTDDGRFTVAWESLGAVSPGQDGSEGAIVSRQLDWPAYLAGSESLINSYTTGDQVAARIAFQGENGFVIVWASYAQDGADHGIFARRVSTTGFLCGDANGNRELTVVDALAVLRASVGSAECPVCLCDVDSNTQVTASDARSVLLASVGLQVDLLCSPCG